MPFIRVPDTVKISFVYNWQGETAVNTFHARKTGGYSSTDMIALATALANTHIGSFMPILATGILLEQVNAVDLDSATGPSVTSTALLPNAGGVSGGSVPNNAAMCLTRKTDLRGRSYRGRIFVPGCPAAMLLSSTEWTTTAVADVTSAYNDLILAAGVEGWEHVVVSYQQGGVVLSEGVATPVTSIYADSTVDSQRRRLAGRGT